MDWGAKIVALQMESKELLALADYAGVERNRGKSQAEEQMRNKFRVGLDEEADRIGGRGGEGREERRPSDERRTRMKKMPLRAAHASQPGCWQRRLSR